jgi:type II secretory pathway pseudopilin PulG
MNLPDDRVLVRNITFALTMAALICFVLIYQFTTKTDAERERARARTTLETIYKLQQSYFQEFGTYLSSDRGNTSDVLRWDDMPGLFEYVVIDHGDTYVALAEADLDGDGSLEIWRVDPKHPEPVLVQRD